MIKPMSLLDVETRPLDEEETKMLIDLYVMESIGFELDMTDGPEPASHAIMRKRLEVHRPDVDATPYATLFAASLCRTPADAVMWAYTFTCMRDRLTASEDTAPITLELLAKQFFPEGVPTDKGRKTAWKDQKAAGWPLGNKLDGSEVWQPIQEG